MKVDGQRELFMAYIHDFIFALKYNLYTSQG